jgi:hypothetical protein
MVKTWFPIDVFSLQIWPQAAYSCQSHGGVCRWQFRGHDDSVLRRVTTPSFLDLQSGR